MNDGAGFRLVPEWARDGSYLVFRRLRQNVHLFHKFLSDNKGVARAPEPGSSGAGLPAHRSCRRRQRDDPDRAGNNDFDFVAGPGQADICPADAHIRKVNPRSDLVSAEDRLRHRLLRRGIPFGPQSTSTPKTQAMTTVWSAGCSSSPT